MFEGLEKRLGYLFIMIHIPFRPMRDNGGKEWAAILMCHYLLKRVSHLDTIMRCQARLPRFNAYRSGTEIREMFPSGDLGSFRVYAQKSQPHARASAVIGRFTRLCQGFVIVRNRYICLIPNCHQLNRFALFVPVQRCQNLRDGYVEWIELY